MPEHKGTQTIKTGRLTLRKFSVDDAINMFDNWAKDERVTKYLSWDPHADADVSRETLQEWAEHYKEDTYYHWAIELEGEAIGSIGVVDISDRNSHGTIGYCIGYDYWGKGIMTEALKAVLGFMFDEVKMHRLEAFHDVLNIGSGKVMEKTGMVPEGFMREYFLRKDGTYADMRMCSILKHEWERINNNG